MARSRHLAPSQLPLCAGEWLCWPCREFEAEQRLKGVPQSEIRPPRWEMAARGITNAQLQGGSNSAPCVLCPMRSGCFKRTADGKDWCHLVSGVGLGACGGLG